MANKKISELTEKATFGDDDFLAGTQGTGATDNRKYGKAALLDAVGGGLKYHGRLTVDNDNPTWWVLEEISNSTGSIIQLDEFNLAAPTIVNDKGLVAKEVNVSMGRNGSGYGGFASYYVSGNEVKLLLFKLSATNTLEYNDSQEYQISIEIYY